MLNLIKQYYDQYKQYSGFAIIGVLIIVGILFFIHPESQSKEIEAQSNNKSGTQVEKENKTLQKKDKSDSNFTNETRGKVKTVVVDVKGAVEHPDIYVMKDNQRIKDVLTKAKITAKADLTTLNLSEKLTDQKMIVVPEKGQILASSTSNEHASNTKATNNPQSKVNLNNAKESELTSVNGLGPSKAKAIIEFRETKGPFNSVDQLKNVKGIGEKSFEKLKDYFTV